MFGRPPRRQRSLRALAILVHRYVGLAMAVFLCTAGITGSLLAFYQELDDTLNRDLARVSAPRPDAPLLDPFVLRDALQAHVPSEVRVNRVPLDLQPGRAAAFFVTAKSGDNQYFVDPYSARVLGSRRTDDPTQGLKSLMPFLLRLHYSLALGEVGSYLFGGAALLWTIDCFVGAYLTFPPRRSSGAPSKSLWARWKPAWLIRANRLFSLVFTWHRASGLWLWAMLLVFAWSSVGLNLREVYNPVMRLGFGVSERAFERIAKLASPRPEPKLDWQSAYATARELMRQEARRHSFTIVEERTLSYDAVRGVYRLRAFSSLDISRRFPATSLWFDGDTGALVAFEAPTGPSAPDPVSTWLNQLHFGAITVGGLPYRIFVSLMGLLVTVLSITGVWIWWKKRSKTHNSAVNL